MVAGTHQDGPSDSRWHRGWGDRPSGWLVHQNSGPLTLYVDGLAETFTDERDVRELVHRLDRQRLDAREAHWRVQARLGWVLEQLANSIPFGTRLNVGRDFGIHPRTTKRCRRIGRAVCDSVGRVDDARVRELLDRYGRRDRRTGETLPAGTNSIEAAIAARDRSENTKQITEQVGPHVAHLQKPEQSTEQVGPHVAQLKGDCSGSWDTAGEADEDAGAFVGGGATLPGPVGELVEGPVMGEQLGLGSLYERAVEGAAALRRAIDSGCFRGRGERLAALVDQIERELGAVGADSVGGVW